MKNKLDGRILQFKLVILNKMVKAGPIKNVI